MIFQKHRKPKKITTMTIYNFKHISGDKTFFMGDMHGNFKSAAYYIKQHQNIFTNSIIISLGDCGLGFEKYNYYMEILWKANKTLQKLNTYIIMIRGNHDDPDYFINQKIQLSNIFTIPDYTVIQTNNNKNNILCIGGALSTDKDERLKEEDRINKHRTCKRKLYWDNELPILNVTEINNIVKSNININILATHTIPQYITLYHNTNIPTTYGKYIKYQTTTNTIDNIIMNDIFTQLSKSFNIKQWFAGHLHKPLIGKKENTTIHVMPLIDNKHFLTENMKNQTIGNITNY